MEIHFFSRYDLHSGISNKIENHDDIATCVEYSTETRKLATSFLQKSAYMEHIHQETLSYFYVPQLVFVLFQSANECNLS